MEFGQATSDRPRRQVRGFAHADQRFQRHAFERYAKPSTQTDEVFPTPEVLRNHREARKAALGYGGLPYDGKPPQPGQVQPGLLK